MFEDNDDTPVNLTINKAYANKYQTWREKEEKQKLIARYGSDIEDDSDEESEDENAQEWTNEVEKEFLRCYSILKKRDPKIYDSNTTFFNLPSSSNDNNQIDKKKKEKKMNLKDAEIQYAFAEAMNKDEDHNDNHIQTNGKKSIIEEQEEIKNSFKNALPTTDDDVLLTKKIKTEAEKAKEEEVYIEWLKGQKTELPDSSIKSDLKYLHDYWNDPSLSERDRFLRDFILNKMHLQHADDDDEDDETRIPSYDEIINQNEDEDEDEDEEFEKAEEFERKYNFRFQEPDSEFLKRYSRTIDDSVRRKDDRRKLKRAEKKQRKEFERKQKLEEIKRLKNLKKKEIFDKMKRLKTVAGDEDLPVNMDDLDADFDPKEYDRRMQELFNDDYYQKGADEKDKPEVSDDELQVENWDNTEEEQVSKPVQLNNQEEQITKKSKKKLKLRQAIAQTKPTFDPKEKSFEQYFDEYYKLDCEDFIGNTPVRFQYRQVEPNNFGLTVEEILAAEDRELNAWCSLKKTSQYRSKDEELRDYHVYKNKAKNIEKKQKILTSVYQQKNDKDDNDDDK
ncbi:unnamed protein product, partial [Rotaria sordida]